MRVCIPEVAHLTSTGTLGLVAFLATSAVHAQAPEDVVLTLARSPNGIETLDLTMEDLAQVRQVTIRTETEFSDGEVAYRGPLVREVLALLALDQADLLRFTAANDYYVDIPTEDFHTYDAILATEADGRPLSLRDKGPLWLMYPISEYEQLRDPVYVSRLIWQVVRIESL